MNPHFLNWRIPAEDILESGPVIPVIVIDEAEKAVALAEALLEAGIRVLEITLRTEAAIEAISAISGSLPEALVGAGTVLQREGLMAVADAGGLFAISPGLTPGLLDAASEAPIPLIPGISTVSELMTGLERGLRSFKFFPAEAAGGIRMLKAISGPFPQARFCPTGGIFEGNYRDYLALENVVCVGGSWICPRELIEQGEWKKITELAKRALALAQKPEETA